jgi:hypothetical protein
MNFTCFVVLLFVNSVFAQDLFLKSSFYAIGVDALHKNHMYKLDPIDIYEDGNLELPVNLTAQNGDYLT